MKRKSSLPVSDKEETPGTIACRKYRAIMNKLTPDERADLLSDAARVLGKMKTEKKAKASRANGGKGKKKGLENG